MCGIVGIYNFNPNIFVDEETVTKMAAHISHRGPDGDGFYWDKNIGLGHKRLAIIDIASGHQPMIDDENEIVLIFNGEIYNYIEIRDTLMKRGVSFKTKSDTEVIIKGYLKWGERCVDQFNGMWAFALFDKRKRSLFCSRDRCGIKPFYYIHDSDRFVFASEIKAFRALDSFRFTINKQVLWDHFVFGPKYSGETYIEGIKELEPGSNIIIDKGTFFQKKYFRLEETFSGQASRYDLDEIKMLFFDAIRLQLRSDVPLATINSGGIDSSIISAYAKQHTPDLKTYSVAPETDLETKKTLPGDESYYAELLSGYIGSEHKTIRYSDDNFYEYLNDTVEMNDGELYHSNSVPMNYLFSRIKKDRITVVLGGEGADEIFRGYYSNRLLHLSKIAGNLAAEKLIFRKYPQKKYLMSQFSDIKRVIPHIRSSFLVPEKANKILKIEGEIHGDRKRLFSVMSEMSPENALCYYEQTTYLAGLLRRADRMSMKNQIELRVPFLDHRLVQKMNSIKFNEKCGLLRQSEKKILKQISRDLLPNEIIQRKKMGFGSPIRTYSKFLYSRLSGFQRLNDNSFEIDEIWIINTILEESLLSEIYS